MTESATACDTLSAGETNSRVSIIIPYFKQEAFLNEALQSVRQQSYPNLEIIVVDDGSPVPAKDVLAACPSPELEHLAIYRTENGGCPTARNFGFKQSSGEYLLFLDSDDKLIPGAIEAHLRAFSKQPAAGLSFGSARIIDEGSRVVCHPPLCRPRKNYFSMFLEANPIACPGAAMLRRQAFVEAGLFDETFQIVEDYRLYLMLARSFPVAQHQSCVVEYRQHANNASSDKHAMLQATIAALDRLESEVPLSEQERRQLARGRKRWVHAFSPQDTITHKLKDIYYKLHSLGNVPLTSYFFRSKWIFPDAPLTGSKFPKNTPDSR